MAKTGSVKNKIDPERFTENSKVLAKAGISDNEELKENLIENSKVLARAGYANIKAKEIKPMENRLLGIILIALACPLLLPLMIREED